MGNSRGGRARALGGVLVAGLSLLGLVGVPASGASAASAPKKGYIVELRPGVSAAAIARTHVITVGEQFGAAIDGFAADLTPAQAQALRADAGVVAVSREARFTASHVTQITARAARRVGADLSSTVSGDGSGTVAANIAVLDTGVDGRSDDLNYGGGYNCFRPGNPTKKATIDPNGHGTFVAGVAAALDNTIDVVGIAPGARVWGVRVLNKHGWGTTRTIICGLNWAISTRSDADPNNDIDVVNMSLGGPGRANDGACGTTNHDALHQAVCAAVASGIVVVAGAGNDAAPIEGVTPAEYPEVLTATGIQDTDGQPGALGPNALDAGGCDAAIGDDVAADFSNYVTDPANDAHVVAAPATCISSLLPGNQVGVWEGTSFATPNVSGVVALCIASGACAGLTPAQIVAKIVADTATYNEANPGYGFDGDPQHPVAGKYYGNLVRAALY
jgi:subtilisin